jgi:hypothetical protein
MAQLFDYMSWNIQAFSERHSQRKLIMGVEVRAWIAKMVLDMQANLLGVMEVTCGHGADACQLLCDSFNTACQNNCWGFLVSDVNSPGSKADKYALLYATAPFSYDTNQFTAVQIFNLKIDPKNIDWQKNRVPLFWQTVAGGKTVNCMLWHAPQPKDHLKRVTISHIAQLALQLEQETQVTAWVISGDFNFDTGNAAVYQDLLLQAFTGIFDGQLTTLTSLKSFIANNKERFVKADQYDEAYLASAYDNVFIKGVTIQDALRIVVPNLVLSELMNNPQFQIVTRSKAAEALAQAGMISDHLPLVGTLSG